MRTSDKGIDFLKDWEKLRLKAYLDGGGVPTIGWGHTRGVKMGQTCTVEEAEQFLRNDLHEAELCVEKQVPYGLAPHQFDMLVSLTFNIGVTAFAKSTLLRKLISSDIKEAANQFERWRFDNGKEVTGLCNRRNAEKKIFLEGY